MDLLIDIEGRNQVSILDFVPERMAPE